MHEGTLTVVRDVALILLVLEALVLAIVPGAILYYATRWLAGFLPQVCPFIRPIVERVRKIQSAVIGVMLAIRRPFVVLRSLGTGFGRIVTQVLYRR